MSVAPDQLVPGVLLPALHVGPLTRATLALYAGGSGDHIPLHIDQDFARAAGHRDVFMHGMLGVAFILRAVTSWCPQEWVRDYQVRFVSITYPGESLIASARVEAVSDGRAVLAVALHNSEGELKISGRVSVSPGA